MATKSTKSTVTKFQIEKQDRRSKKNEKWNPIKVQEDGIYVGKTDGKGNIVASSENEAVRIYCPSLRQKGKVKNGQGTTNRGRTFRAIPVK